MNCPNCNTQNADGAKFCNNCGYNFENQQAQATQQPTQAQFQQPYQQPNIIINNVATANATAVGGFGVSPKSKMVALILCVFGGFLGLHQFYAGSIGKGILYLFTFGVFGIMWIIDILRILAGTFKDGNGLPITK